MNKITILNDKRCKLDSDDPDLLKRVHRYLSYKLKGVEYSAAYQNGWSGITYLFSKNQTFELGLLNHLLEFLSNLEVEIEDLRVPSAKTPPIDLMPKLLAMGKPPRDYQELAVEASCNVSRGIIRAATGSGKTQIAAMLVAKLNKPAVVYVIGLDLLDQFHSFFSSLFNEPIGYIGNGTCDLQRITIASVWSVASAIGTKAVQDDERSELSPSEESKQKIKEWIKTIKVSVYDECHAVTCSSIQDIYKASSAEHIYGLSGTPYRDDGSDLLIKAMLGEMVINITASELIAKGVLAQPMIKFVPVPKKSGMPKDYQSVYKEYVVENDERNNLIVSQLKNLVDKKYKPLVSFKTIAHGEILLQKILDKGILCEMLHGEDSLDRRMEVRKNLEEKRIQCILASTIFDIGVDIPCLDALVLAGPSKGRVRTYQRIGRVIRSFPGKKIAAVVDFFDQCKHLKDHSFARCSAYIAEPGFKVIRCAEMK